MRAVALALLFTGLALPAEKLPQFEVATLKQSPPPTGDSYSITLGLVHNSQVTFTNVTLSDCVQFAWNLVSEDQVSGPGWIKSKAVRFDIVGKAPPGTDRDTIALMTRSLLEERLKLAVHSEPREIRHLVLTAPGASKMHRVGDDPTQPAHNSGRYGHIKGDRVSMLLLATLLSRLEHQIVVDETGLMGLYEVDLEWVPGSATAGTEQAENATGASLFTAVREQLGLRLESRKSPVETIVVDHAEQTPAEN